MVTTIIFDFDGVFTTSPRALVRAAAHRYGVDPDLTTRLLLGAVGDDDHPWQRVERGVLALADARTWALLETKHRLGVEIDLLEVLRPTVTDGLRGEMVSLLHDLQASDLTLGLLTKDTRELREYWSALLDWDTLFDRVIDSNEIDLRRPTPDVFLFALELCGETEPSRALLVDDSPEYVESARSIGMRAVLVGEHPTSAIDQIRAMIES